MVKSKRQSKRITLSRRYNIAAKVKEHDRKAKRNAKKNPKLRTKLRKDPGIPNMNPFKAQIVARLSEQQKLIKFQQAQSTRRSQEAAARRKLGGGAKNELAGLAAHAAARGDTFASGAAAAAADDDEQQDTASAGARAAEQSRRAFYRHVKALMEKADILLEVLDARDPLGCRAAAVEALALSQSPPKKIILVLNKIDLVPPPVAARWLAYLRREFPTVAFKASTQEQRHHLSARGGAAINKATEAGEVLTGSGSAGTDTLLQLIKNYSRSHDIKTAVTVGVIGYPNVGKSSVINSLKRSRAVGVSPIAGFTRSLQEVSLDSKVTLIDCPGIIFEDDAAAGATGASSLILRNCVSVDSIDDPEGVVGDILARCAPAKLMALYAIPAYEDAGGFLRLVAGKRGRVGKGGVPDIEATARMILADWNSGKIPFFVLPPDGKDGLVAAGDDETMEGGASAASSSSSSSEIVQSWGKEFDVAALLAEADAALFGDASRSASSSSSSSSSASSSSSSAAAGGVGAGDGVSLGVSAPLRRDAAARSRLAAGVAGAAAATADGAQEEEGDDDDGEDDDVDMEGRGDAAGDESDDDDDDDDDDSGDDDDDEEEEDDDDEEEEEEPAAPAPRAAAAAGRTKAPSSLQSTKPSAATAARGAGATQSSLSAPAGGRGAAQKPHGKRAAPAAASSSKGAAKKSQSGDAYDFGEYFKQK